MLLGQFSLTFEYRPRAQHANADGLRQCGQCLRPDCPVSSPEGDAGDSGSTLALLDQPFASSAMGDSMDADLLPELSGETRVATTYLDEVTADLPPDGQIVLGCPWRWSWKLQFENLSIVSEDRLWRRRTPPATTSQLVVPLSERRAFIQRYHDFIFTGHLGVSRTVYRLLDPVSVRRFGRIWLAVRSVWRENLPALGRVRSVTFRWVIIVVTG